MNSTFPTTRQPGLFHRYLFWTYQRGSFHYDIMVTLILLFLFIAPHVIDFHDRPNPEIPARSAEVLIRDAGTRNGQHRFVYEIRAEDVHNLRPGADPRQQLTTRIHTIAPGVTVAEIWPVHDPRGHIVAYDATVLR